MNGEATAVAMQSDVTRKFLGHVQSVLGRRSGYVADYVLPVWLEVAKKKKLDKVEFVHQKVCSYRKIYANKTH